MKVEFNSRLTAKEFDLARGSQLMADLISNHVRVLNGLSKIADEPGLYDALVVFLNSYRGFKGHYYYDADHLWFPEVTVYFSHADDLRLFMQDFGNSYL